MCLRKHLRYRDAGQPANMDNVAEYGQPARSLFTSTKVLSLHHDIDVTDENENVVYHAHSKVFSIRDKTDITNAAGLPVAHIERKVFSLHERHYVTMADGKQFEISNELWHLVKDVSNIEGLGWQLRGNIAGLNFQLYDSEDKIIAVIGQKLISLHDKYCIDIYRPELEAIVVAIQVTLQHIMTDRAASSAATTTVSTSGSGT